jgi:mannose-6-phosphate isomerase-like protein (cupin superfamily)
MIPKLRIDAAAAVPEFGMHCQRLIPWAGDGQEPPLGAMACFLDPGRDSDPDRHDQVEVMVVLAGSGAVTVAGDRTMLAAGDLVVLPRNAEHVVHNRGDRPLSWLSVYWPLREPGREAG